jgi:hypothetical protein
LARHAHGSPRQVPAQRTRRPNPAYDPRMIKKLLILAVLVALGAVAAKRLRGN